MKPLIIGMGPSPQHEFEDVPWHPLAPTSRNLAKLVFDDWAAMADVEANFELVNLNETCVQKQSDRGEDVVDPQQAAATLTSLDTTGALSRGRVVFLLGRAVQTTFCKWCRNDQGLLIKNVYHPSILLYRKRWPDKSGDWRTKMRSSLRRSIGLDDMVYEDCGLDHEVQWADFERRNWNVFLKRGVPIRFTKEQWIELVGRETSPRLELTDWDRDVFPPWDSPGELQTFGQELQHELQSYQDDYSRSDEEGWFHSDD